MLGLRSDDLIYIKEAISQFNEIDKAVIFGSRAKGNYKQGSDVDITLYGENITWDTVSRLQAALEEESHMPYFFDVVAYDTINNHMLKEHIDRVGVTIYERHDIKNSK